VIRSAASLKSGDLLRTKFADGETNSRVVDAGAAGVSLGIDQAVSGD
jgi:exonuclease VII large subunit